MCCSNAGPQADLLVLLVPGFETVAGPVGLVASLLDEELMGAR